LVHIFPVFNKRNTSILGSSPPPPSVFLLEEPRRMRNLEDLYDVTKFIKDMNLFRFFINSNPLNFNEANRKEMDISNG
jgi:hypothetical protein